jgi:hypothetical protein
LLTQRINEGLEREVLERLQADGDDVENGDGGENGVSHDHVSPQQVKGISALI